MTTVWCDTETTGIDPRNSGAFEFAFLVYRRGELLEEKVFHLNPLNDEVRFGEEAYKINGVGEETIRSYAPASEVVPEIAVFLKKHVPPERLVFAGYNSGFDYRHLDALLARYGFNTGDYFDGRMIDVFKLVKNTSECGLLPKTPDKKLATMTKSLGIKHDDAHTAFSDIKATRELYEKIYLIWREKK
jgi:DNA polymerase III alpha subunit (gram-positive type)